MNAAIPHLAIMVGAPIWVFVLLGILAAAVVVVIVVISKSKSGPRAAAGGEAACGQCGYNVRGLSTFICPECGSDLRDVGIVKGGRTGGRRWLHLLWIIPVWVVGCMMFGLLLSQLIDAMAADPKPGVFVQHYGAKIAVPLMMLIGLGGLVWIIYRTANALPLWPFTSRGSSAGGSATGAPAPAPPPRAPSSQPGTTKTAVLTIMFIDMADYTQRTAAASREGVIDLIRKVRELVQPALQRRRGRIIKTVGDGFLVTFESPTEAVLCGRDVQQAIDRYNATHPDAAAPLALRIGVTTGEVALEDNDVYGEPVNLANRIQQLAEPGKVYFSEATYHAMTRSEVVHELVGEFDLKGVSDKVRVFRTTP